MFDPNRDHRHSAGNPTPASDRPGTSCGEPDHVDLLVHHPPTFARSRLVTSLHGISTRRLRQQDVGPIDRARTAGHVWPTPYFAASCGGAPLEILKEYIRGQKHPDQAGASSRA